MDTKLTHDEENNVYRHKDGPYVRLAQVGGKATVYHVYATEGTYKAQKKDMASAEKACNDIAKAEAATKKKQAAVEAKAKKK